MELFKVMIDGGMSVMNMSVSVLGFSFTLWQLFLFSFLARIVVSVIYRIFE